MHKILCVQNPNLFRLFFSQWGGSETFWFGSKFYLDSMGSFKKIVSYVDHCQFSSANFFLVHIIDYLYISGFASVMWSRHPFDGSRSPPFVRIGEKTWIYQCPDPKHWLQLEPVILKVLLLRPTIQQDPGPGNIKRIFLIVDRYVFERCRTKSDRLKIWIADLISGFFYSIRKIC